MLAELRSGGVPLLELVGSDEFVSDGLSPTGAFVMPAATRAQAGTVRRPETPIYPAQDRAVLAVKAYSYLKVDAGRLSPFTAGWLKKAAGSLPAGFLTVDTEPVAKAFNTPAGIVGVLFFPTGDEPGRTPSAAQMQATRKAGHKLKDSCDLVVGISPWGMQAEKEFLPMAQGVFDCLLGGGEGPGFAQSVNRSAPGVLWSRSDVNGRALCVIDVLELPARAQAADWLEGVTFRASLTYLEGKQAPDRGMIKIIGEGPN